MGLGVTESIPELGPLEVPVGLVAAGGGGGWRQPGGPPVVAVKTEERALGQGMRAASGSWKRHGNPTDPQSKRSLADALVLAAGIRWTSGLF